MNSGHSVFSIYIKPKDPEHIPILLESPEVQFLIKKYRINLNMIANKRHDIETVIDAADKVISIGFTTPGLDALGKKKASVYFTPYKGIYNPIFDSVDTPLVVHNVDELKSFLSGEIHPSNELLDSVLYRSGESTGVRLVAATIQAIATRGY
jgi:polysaccharide biosynthesis PFTS motif protein